MEAALFQYCGIRRGGFTINDEAYLNFLRENGRAGLTTLVNVLQIPRQVIINEIEPFLLRKNLIQITSRGRVINDNAD
jgi:Holliday junction resolvasome RuvABC ATP-dependent DNA helicase subunit